MHGSVKSLTLGVAQGMLRSGTRLLYVIQFADFGDHCILEAFSLIRVDS